VALGLVQVDKKYFPTSIAAMPIANIDFATVDGGMGLANLPAFRRDGWPPWMFGGRVPQQIPCNELQTPDLCCTDIPLVLLWGRMEVACGLVKQASSASLGAWGSHHH